MCRVYNTVGCLTKIKFHLRQNNINDFKSLNEVIAFQKNYSNSRQQIISEHEHFISGEKNSLEIDITRINNLIQAQRRKLQSEIMQETEALTEKLNGLLHTTPINLIQRIASYLKEWYYRKKIHSLALNIESKNNRLARKLMREQTKKNNRYQYICSHFTDAVNESSFIPLQDIERKKRIIDELNTSIYGALGEQKVVKELQNLSDEYILINDFSLSFPKPIYNRKENDYIKSIQIDHILVAPSGLFLIETKNWSNDSLMNSSLRSPVQQIKRTSFALFKIINQQMVDFKLNLNSHHWGNRKISIRNLIVLTNSKPKEIFSTYFFLQRNPRDSQQPIESY